MIQLFQKHILKNFPFLQSKNLLIACSGGMDSIVLMHLMYELNFSITLAHCNFQLRDKESDLDEKFVLDQGKKFNLPVLTKHFETKINAQKGNKSIQMAARDLRYHWFEELIQNNDFDFLLTAHHADDSLETFLINLSRGTGLDGLTGIPVINNKVIRPLLPLTRKQLENYAKQNKLIWREDKSNIETKYLRNKLRHNIIPLLKELNPNFMNSFVGTVENLKGSQQIIKETVHKLKKEIIENNENIIKINISKINRLANPKVYLFELLKEYGFAEWNDIANLLNAQSGKRIYSSRYRLLKDRSELYLSKITVKTENKEFKIEESRIEFSNKHFRLKLEKSEKLSFDDNIKRIIYIDKALLKFPLIVRKWEKGDYFYPIGMQGRKKLSKFFKDEKLSIIDKEETWLLCSANNDIIWIIEKRLDNRFKITNDTTEILKIDYEKTP